MTQETKIPGNSFNPYNRGFPCNLCDHANDWSGKCLNCLEYSNFVRTAAVTWTTCNSTMEERTKMSDPIVGSITFGPGEAESSVLRYWTKPVEVASLSLLTTTQLLAELRKRQGVAIVEIEPNSSYQISGVGHKISGTGPAILLVVRGEE